MKYYRYLSLLLLFVPLTNAEAARLLLENDDFRIRLATPTPNSLAAFYEGRGFPKSMIEEIRQTCFINLVLRNKSTTIVWYDLANWHFTTTAGDLTPYSRAYWKSHWQQQQIEARHNATFRWTLMPESLDFQPGEGEGGNIVLPRSALPMTITGQLAIGRDKQKIVAIKFEDVRCGQDSQP